MSYAHYRYRTVQDWVRLRPLLGPYKHFVRYAAGLAYTLKPAPDPAALTALCENLGRRPLALTVAYNSVWMLAWQLRFGRRNFGDIDRLIVDNSSDPEAAHDIERLCREAGVHYLKLPFNRFSLGRPKDASLSHACALNWTWHHVIARVRPPLVAVLDHDLIPLRPVNFESKLRDQPFYGVRANGRDESWHLWPGYAVLSDWIIGHYKLNFWVDCSAGLDTGGSNWRRVFAHFDPARLRFVDAPELFIGRFEEWWHVGGASEYGVKPEGWRDEVESVLKREYAALSSVAVAGGSVLLRRGRKSGVMEPASASRETLTPPDRRQRRQAADIGAGRG